MGTRPVPTARIEPASRVLPRNLTFMVHLHRVRTHGALAHFDGEPVAGGPSSATRLSDSPRPHAPCRGTPNRSEERRVGKECVSTFSTRWWAEHEKQQKKN